MPIANSHITSAVFITFAGNCRKALTFYQSLFGGRLRLQTFGGHILGYEEVPVVSGSLISQKIVIHGTDLVHDEGRKTGNYISIFLPCKCPQDRKKLIHKLEDPKLRLSNGGDEGQKLVEITDAFDVRWILSV